MNTKIFLKYLDKMKTKRLLALERMSRRNHPNLVMDINLNDRIDETFNFANIIAEAMAEYKSWNTRECSYCSLSHPIGSRAK